jgi:protein-S-isoprenylcysteine O-methyltransferase Ste14
MNLRRYNREVIGDLAARAFVGTLFVLLSRNLLADFMRTGRITGLLFLTSEALVVVLTIVRRRARLVDRSFISALTTTVSLVGPPLLRVADSPALVPDALTAIISTVGLAIVITGKLTIGRSFGLAPANRGVVARGPYNVVRHPIYAGYLLTHAAVLAAYPSIWNISIVLAGDTALVLRALLEERVLSSDAQYQVYCRRVGWHLVPGVF